MKVVKKMEMMKRVEMVMMKVVIMVKMVDMMVVMLMDLVIKEMKMKKCAMVLHVMMENNVFQNRFIV